MSERRGGQVPWAGVALLALGALFLGDQLGWWVFGDFFRDWWPAILVAIGLTQVADARGPRAGGLILILIGGLLLLDRFGLLPVSVWQLWPLALILVGLSLLMRGRAPTARGDDEDALGISVFLSGVERVVTSKAFRGGSVSAVLGGVDLDLRQAQPVPGGAELHCSVLLGGLELRVPSGWEVKLDGMPLLGSLRDARKAPAPAADAPVLRLRCSATLGSVEIKD